MRTLNNYSVCRVLPSWAESPTVPAAAHTIWQVIRKMCFHDQAARGPDFTVPPTFRLIFSTIGNTNHSKRSGKKGELMSRSLLRGFACVLGGAKFHNYLPGSCRSDGSPRHFFHVPTTVKAVICFLLFLQLAGVGWIPEVNAAEEAGPDFTEIEFESLLKVELVPIDAIGDNLIFEDQILLSVQYRLTNLDGVRDGSSSISTSKVHESFFVSPTSMTIEELIFTLAYAPTDTLFLRLQVPFIRKEMDNESRPEDPFTFQLVSDTKFTTETEGVGDTELSAVYTFYSVEKVRHRLQLQVGMSIPTGSIDERGSTPSFANARLPYQMQLGTGTLDPILGLIYSGKTDDWAWGSELIGTFRVGVNKNEYRFGDQYNFNGWAAWRLSEGVALKGGLEGLIQDEVEGADKDMNPALSPTDRPDFQGGERLDLTLGLNIYASGNWFFIEAGVPVFQSTNGPQLETELWALVGWQIIF